MAQTFRSRTVFPLANGEPGDLVFFHRIPKNSCEFEMAIISSSLVDANIYHVAVLVDGAEQIVHATPDNGVQLESLGSAIDDLQPDLVELVSLSLDSEWKQNASLWALEQIGAEYNDIFSASCLNSKKRKSFYCCQLAEEAYKNTFPFSTPECPLGQEDKEQSTSPFLPHKMNFLDAKGQMIPYWIDYYKQLCPENPVVPQGAPGSHPSILRASPISHLAAARALLFADQSSSGGYSEMKKFSIPHDLLTALHFVGGARVNLKSQRKFNVFEPRNGEHLAEINSAGPSHVEEVVQLSRKAQKNWGLTPWGERRQVLQRAADLIRKHANEISVWEVRDNGKSITEAKADVLSCAETFEYFSGTDLAGEHLPYADRSNRFAYTRREPFGVIGAIGAWNYPIQTATWKIAPAIACGNSVVYKPSPLAPISSVLLAQLLQCAGLPDGVLNVIQGESETGAALCESPLVQKQVEQFSVSTGKLIAKTCADYSMKPVTLELGGKSSCIMLKDCDMDMAVNGAVIANFFSQGQVCSNASKILVDRTILDEFTSKLLLKTEALRIGDPLNESTHVGACISLTHLQKVQSHIQGAVKEGAKVLYGGERVIVEALEKGAFLSPCVMSQITPEMKIYSEEVFGAVLLLIPFDTEEEALRMANDTEFGLAAGIFTNDLNKAHNLAARLEAGTVYINTYNDTSPLVPFGGCKQSGYGRENGKAAVENYTQVKSVFVNTSSNLDNPFQ